MVQIENQYCNIQAIYCKKIVRLRNSSSESLVGQPIILY